MLLSDKVNHRNEEKRDKKLYYITKWFQEYVTILNVFSPYNIILKYIKLDRTEKGTS